jgi:putative nucleotidyltransferase with HDIG domain
MTVPARLLDQIDHLEPLPTTVRKLVTALHDEQTSVADVARLVELDQAVGANVLRVASSSLYRGKFPIKSIRDSVVRLGLKTILSVALDGHLKKYRTDAPMYDLTEDDLWLHGAVASLAVGELSKVVPDANIPEEAAIAALVHDIGKVIMVRFMRVDVRVLLNLSKEKQVPFVDAEREVLGCDHAEVGAAMARKWQFPDDITNAIEHHHDSAPEDPTPMLDAVMAANLVTKAVGVGLGAEGLSLSPDRQLSHRLGLTFTLFCQVCANTGCKVSALREDLPVRSAAPGG